MLTPRKSMLALVVAAAFAAAGCNSDEAAKKDIKNGAQEVDKAAKDAANGVEKEIPGDSNDNGK